MKKFDSGAKKYFVLMCDSVNNPEGIDFYISIDKIKGKPKITFPMKSNIETKTVKAGDTEVCYNPISVTLSYPTAEKIVCDWCGVKTNYLYFRMKNGEIKTFS